MRVEVLMPDAAMPLREPGVEPFAFGKALDDAGAALDRATTAEDAYAAGNGTLQSAIYQRARADVALSVAAATAQRAAQAVQSILNMQI